MKRFSLLSSGVAFCALAAAGAAQADVIGAAIGGGAWQQSPSGWAQWKDNDRVDLEDDLQVNDETGGYVWVALEHPVPVLPNIKLRYIPMSFEGDGTVSDTFTFRNTTFTAGRDVSSKAELNQTDVILYYELLDNVVSLDAGLNVKVVDGYARVRDKTTGDEDKVDFNAPLPMLYANFRVDLPLTGLHLDAEGSGISYSGNRMLDLKAGVGYDFAFGLGVEAGYWRQSLKIDDIEDVSTDLDIGGPYLGAYLDF